jgi:RNA polymerase sigma-70 factor (ECF subfamily)
MAIPDEQWEPTLKRLLPKLLALARRLAGSRMASSVVAETVLRAYEKRHQMHKESEPEVAAFVNTVLRRTIYNRWRERPEEPLNEDDEPTATAWAVPADEVARLERMLTLLDALEQVPEREREVVLLHHLSGMTMVEIAQQLGRPYDVIVRDRDRAQKILRRLLEPEDRP